MTHAQLETTADRDANGSRMTCNVILTLGRTERYHMKSALEALDEAYKSMRLTLKEWEEKAP